MPLNACAYRKKGMLLFSGGIAQLFNLSVASVELIGELI